MSPKKGAAVDASADYMQRLCNVQVDALKTFEDMVKREPRSSLGSLKRLKTQNDALKASNMAAMTTAAADLKALKAQCRTVQKAEKEDLAFTHNEFEQRLRAVSSAAHKKVGELKARPKKRPAAEAAESDKDLDESDLDDGP